MPHNQSALDRSNIILAAGCCEHGNEPLRSIQGEEFHDQLSLLSASQEGLCSRELIIIIIIIIITIIQFFIISVLHQQSDGQEENK
jgi:hypothetical protein